jgi:hypothetical protein
VPPLDLQQLGHCLYAKLWLLRKHSRQITWKGDEGKYVHAGMFEAAGLLCCCSEGAESGGDGGDGCGDGVSGVGDSGDEDSGDESFGLGGEEPA